MSERSDLSTTEDDLPRFMLDRDEFMAGLGFSVTHHEGRYHRFGCRYDGPAALFVDAGILTAEQPLPKGYVPCSPRWGPAPVWYMRETHRGGHEARVGVFGADGLVSLRIEEFQPARARREGAIEILEYDNYPGQFGTAYVGSKEALVASGICGSRQFPGLSNAIGERAEGDSWVCERIYGGRYYLWIDKPEATDEQTLPENAPVRDPDKLRAELNDNISLQLRMLIKNASGEYDRRKYGRRFCWLKPKQSRD